MMNISTRKTIRKYTQQPISDELLNRLLEEASHTQTMGNLQLYSVVVTRSQEASRGADHLCRFQAGERLV